MLAIKVNRAFHKLNKHATPAAGTALKRNEPIVVYLTSTQEQKIQDALYFLEEEQLIYCSRVEEKGNTDPRIDTALELIPLPRLFNVLET
ncbi:hypothetical protein CHL76_16415 [Marinococcus halophilus]|uniref:Uncharacterized protein n=1 Tax=Marinococcus halophilus TaxID=1371 RepID=A0A510YAY5_MARHA|nr:hypothetical protein [Marinococcus halophilus]OZT78735.1 hypothetical protein CHL76_16415 [Marinococcus halophilus]GEK60313.1 hypothetical protein MHA01_32180 [Marinococcus halophilus]